MPFHYVKKKTWKVRAEKLDIEVTGAGIKFSVWDEDEHLGDLELTHRGVTWWPIKNKTLKKKRFEEWTSFINLMEGHWNARKVTTVK